ncbi:hypothetical protein [Bacillus changyiensis]|uniref:hypothetical protein n=1 Tax=Bacillus changyiensis TaxID=3004103 RepID=UPI0022E7A115|nr:hypothetical protein [Bacillus changyiensis]MDA1478045.1 hypothetical protein [Bacillus changyiensis]
MTLIEEFNFHLKKFEDQREPVTLALAQVIQKAIDERLMDEYQEFYEWFIRSFYDEGKQNEVFRFPLIDESPIIHGGNPRVIILNEQHVSNVPVIY